MSSTDESSDTPTATKMRPPRLQTSFEAGHEPLTPPSIPGKRGIHRGQSPPQTPQSPSSHFCSTTSAHEPSPKAVPLNFDVSKGQLIGTGLWSKVYKVSSSQEDTSVSLHTPPTTPKKLRAPSLPEVYAVKVANRPDAADVFAQEADTLAHIQKVDQAARFIVPFYCMAEDRTALAFHLSTGGDVEQFAARLDDTQMDDLCITVTQQLSSALAFLHASRVVHADIKPANVLVDSSNNGFLFRFCDFSAAVVHEPVLQTSDSVPNLPSLPCSPMPARSNSARMAIGGGTWMYMAPEQLSANPVTSAPTTRSDVYSLGITLLTFLFRRNPYTGVENNCNVFMLREAIKQGTPLRFAKDDLDLAAVIGKLEASATGAAVIRTIELGLHKKKEERISSEDWAARFKELC